MSTEQVLLISRMKKKCPCQVKFSKEMLVFSVGFYLLLSPLLFRKLSGSATAGKFVYIMLIFKSILYKMFVMGLMPRYKERNRVLVCTHLS